MVVAAGTAEGQAEPGEAGGLDPVDDGLDVVLDRVARRRAAHRVETRLERHGGDRG